MRHFYKIEKTNFQQNLPVYSYEFQSGDEPPSPNWIELHPGEEVTLVANGTLEDASVTLDPRLPPVFALCPEHVFQKK